MQKSRKNIHTSFHELSPREYMYIPKGTLKTGKPGSFSKTELTHLLIAVLFGFAFTIPGAVMFRGDSRRFETGKIAAAGATANLCIASLMFLLYQSFFETPFYGELFGFICLINAFLGTFNLIPLSPLDGKKVIEWNGIVWALLFIWGVVIASLIFPIAPLV